MNDRTTLVVGGTGKTGRRVVERLRARQVPVTVGSRRGATPFDWENPSTWAAPLHGAQAVYITYYPDLAAPGAARAIEAFTRQAVKSGVRQLVLLSGRGEPEAQTCEKIVANAGVDWTVVRASWFAQNFSESYLLDAVLAGDVYLPAGNVGEPFVDADDIADVAVAALTEKGHQGQIYETTGARLYTFAEAVGEIARATGRDLHYVQIPISDYAAELRKAQVPDDVVALLTYLFTEVLDGRNAAVQNGVERALKRPARDFADYVRAIAATGLWNRPATAPAS